MLNFWAIKICSLGLLYSQNYMAGRMQELSRIFRLFWIPPRNSYLNHAPPPPPKKKNLATIFLPQNQKFQNPQNPLIIPVTSNLVYPPWGWDIFVPYLQKLGQNHHFHVWEEPFPKQLFTFSASARATRYYRRPVSSVGRVPVCWAGGREFESWPDQTQGLKITEEKVLSL